jgi:hypothetical protein
LQNKCILGSYSPIFHKPDKPFPIFPGKNNPLENMRTFFTFFPYK